MYDLHRLRLLRELKHRGTLAAVAQALTYSPSTISQQLSQLETEVGVPLLEPVGRRVRLTAEAETLVGHVEAVLARLEIAEAEVAASRTTLTGQLRIATFQTAAASLVLPAVYALSRQHPSLEVRVAHLEPERALPALAAHDFNLVIAEEYPGRPHPQLTGLESETLCEDPIRLAGAGATSLAQLAARPWVMEPEGTVPGQWARALCRQAGFEPDVRYTSTDLTFHTRVVEQGLAVCFLPDLLWHDRPATVTLTDLPEHPSRRVFTAIRQGAHAHPFIRAARAALRTAAEDRLFAAGELSEESAPAEP
ncbi:MAG TPA: LysR family transcriptional regulator [Propionibacteriaceae bacterium]|nr:LysR family transcriptional regulator [Propionibacteriaceae bacterium]